MPALIRSAAILGAVGVGVLSLAVGRRHLLARLFQLPPPRSAVRVRRDLRVPMADAAHADPTPAFGGALLNSQAGPQDNRALEARADVLTYTSAPLSHDLDIVGPVRLELYVTSSCEHTDFFGRLCDVSPDGRSLNICDGILRLPTAEAEPLADGSRRIVIDLWATACRFRQGHRRRVQVSSGAHPRLARNLGTGEPLPTGTQMRVAEQTIYHDAQHPSALVVPVLTPSRC